MASTSTLPFVVVLAIGCMEFGWYYVQLAAVNTVAFELAQQSAQRSTMDALDAKDAARVALNRVGVDCREVRCDINVRRYTERGVRLQELRLTVEHQQITGLLSGEDSMSVFGIDAPNELIVTGVATVSAR
jgi:hypothetical protein